MNDIPILAAKDVSKEYYTFDGAFKKSNVSFYAVNNVNIALYKGKSLAFVGQSGGGKTTLAHILADILPSDSGNVYYKGEPVHKNSPIYPEYRKNVQMVFQNPDQSLNPRLKIYSTLRDFLCQKYQKERDIYAEAVRLLALTGLSEEHLHRYPSELSGGQKQRVSIARALSLNPEIIIADEPVSSLDVSVQAQILNLMADLKEQLGITFILISHNLAVVSWICAKVAVIKNGMIVEYGDTQEVIKHPKHDFTKELVAASL